MDAFLFLGVMRPVAEPIEEKIRDFIMQNPGTYVEEISRRLGYNRATVTKYVRGFVGSDTISEKKKGPIYELWPNNGGSHQ